jgi:flagellar motor switch protein FliN/FliY
MDAKNLDVVLDVKVNLTARLGSCELPMREIVDLAPGTVLQLDRQAKDPIELLVNNKVIAHGEVVVVDDKFGIKITSLVENQD